MVKKPGFVPTDASPRKRRPRSSTTTAASSGPPTPGQFRSKAEDVQLVAFYSHARKCWTVTVERWAHGQTYEFAFTGRLVFASKEDFDIVREYLNLNFPRGVLPNIQAWAGIRSWVTARKAAFHAPVLYVETGDS